MGRGDATSRAVLPRSLAVKAVILAKAPGILAGGQVATWTFQALDRSLRCRVLLADGAKLQAGGTILEVRGAAQSIFAAERVALNFLGHLSGIATLTNQYVRLARGTRTQILDTRKTLPGLRALEKYAVVIGGGTSHRKRLDDAILIKTNHLRALKGGSKIIQEALWCAKQFRPKHFVQIEVTGLPQLREALAMNPDAILLDNWPPSRLNAAVLLRDKLKSRALLEVSGGVTLKNLRAIAKTGVERISIGRLTHSAPSLDVSLRVI